MPKASRNEKASTKGRGAAPAKSRTHAVAAKPAARVVAVAAEPGRVGWATDLVFDVREPKLAVSLRLDADVLRFFRGFGAGYQTRINEVLKAFMQARGGAQPASNAVVSARARSGAGGNGKRAR
ncbi:MAG TPA: hypothetical protein DDZ81_05820 [Acetobacteraceae bacterium]|jgi:uncharacterized protein (DUF4415 family)|nr:hypothetical protein [Acetobacteraceae bacterium]